MKSRLKAFTLAELLVVMGIIVLFIALAIPAVRTMTGSNSSSLARNELAALVTRAREEAVGVQGVRGVLFFIDPATTRVMGVICQAGLQDPAGVPNVLLLDSVSGRDSLLLPTGIRLQTIFNTTNSPNATIPNRYLGYNPVSLSTGNQTVNVGGCILFDGNGRLMSRPYGLQMAQLSNGSPVASNLAVLLFGSSVTPQGVSGVINISSATPPDYSYSVVPFNTSGTVATQTPVLPLSQLGMVLFDTEAFSAQGFLDSDYTGTGTGTPDPMEAPKQTWIDTHSTPIMVNRFDGTLIRGE